MNEFQIVLRSMNAAPFAEVKKAYAIRAKAERGRIEFVNNAMYRAGFELVEPDNGMLTGDGREVARACGKAWALRPEIHAQRLAEAMEQARKRDAQMAASQPQPAPLNQQPTTCTSMIDGQLCGGTLMRAPVCPRCALGKSGVVATLTCDVCGHVMAIMRGGSNG